MVINSEDQDEQEDVGDDHASPLFLGGGGVVIGFLAASSPARTRSVINSLSLTPRWTASSFACLWASFVISTNVVLSCMPGE